MKLVTVDQMRRIEAASDAQGHTYAALMERAGSAVARVIQSRSAVRGRRILLLIGPGNNGGDGLVAARQLHDAGAAIGVCVLKPREDEHVAALRERGVDIMPWVDQTNNPAEAATTPPESRAWKPAPLANLDRP